MSIKHLGQVKEYLEMSLRAPPVYVLHLRYTQQRAAGKRVLRGWSYHPLAALRLLLHKRSLPIQRWASPAAFKGCYIGSRMRRVFFGIAVRLRRSGIA